MFPADFFLIKYVVFRWEKYNLALLNTFAVHLINTLEYEQRIVRNNNFVYNFQYLSKA